MESSVALHVDFSVKPWFGYGGVPPFENPPTQRLLRATFEAKQYLSLEARVCLPII